MNNSKRKLKRTYPRKVEKTWRPQLFCCLLDARIQVRVLDDLLNHLNGVLLVRKKMTNSPLGDRTRRCHQTFTNSVARFERRRLLLFVTHGDDRSFLKGTVIFPFNFPFWQPFPDNFGSWHWHPFFLFFARSSWHPYQGSLPHCLHFCKG